MFRIIRLITKVRLTMKNIIAIFIVTASFLFIAACSQVNTDSRDYHESKKRMRHGVIPLPHSFKSNAEVISSLDLKAVKRGEKLYKNHCYVCHGAKADGNGPESYSHRPAPANLIKVAKKVPNFKFYMKISQWQGEMPGWKSALNDRDIQDVKSYIVYLAHKD